MSIRNAEQRGTTSFLEAPRDATGRQGGGGQGASQMGEFISGSWGYQQSRLVALASPVPAQWATTSPIAARVMKMKPNYGRPHTQQQHERQRVTTGTRQNTRVPLGARAGRQIGDSAGVCVFVSSEGVAHARQRRRLAQLSAQSNKRGHPAPPMRSLCVHVFVFVTVFVS